MPVGKDAVLNMERFLRAYRKVLMVALIFIAIPIIVASFYARPLGDDLNMSLEAARTWRETGSVGQMLAAGRKARCIITGPGAAFWPICLWGRCRFLFLIPS